MYKFLAMRIHDGYLTWDAVKEKGDAVYNAVNEAYTEMYGEKNEESGNSGKVRRKKADS